jgi:hypothetical protein
MSLFFCFIVIFHRFKDSGQSTPKGTASVAVEFLPASAIPVAIHFVT